MFYLDYLKLFIYVYDIYRVTLLSVLFFINCTLIIYDCMYLKMYFSFILILFI